MLEVDIKKKLGGFRLNVQFAAQNEIFALLGASGCGKSVTLQCIAGIMKPDEGRIVLDGRVLFDSKARVDLPPQQRRVGCLFQSYALFPHMTVRQNIGAGIRNAAKAVRDEKVEEKVKRFYLGGLEEKFPGQLSGGQQQRVALARIFASDPRLLMLDEPFSALDSYLRWQLEQELQTTLEAFPGTTLFVSHNRDEVYRLCSTVCLINGGKSEEPLPVRELFAQPRTLSAALLSGCKNYSRAVPEGPRRLFAEDWGVSLMTAEEIQPGAGYVGIRAHFVQQKNGGENLLPCRILRVVEDVFGTIVTLRPEAAKADTDFSRIRMELPKEQAQGLNPGDVISVSLAPENLLLLR
ncbi:MAG TPA: ATP-binding cassette domain-containing protein [Feifaniaceae bacterium]|nr:ATP-binding cassette domain-containing protein [Feifaniaceae bacterium]